MANFWVLRRNCAESIHGKECAGDARMNLSNRIEDQEQVMDGNASLQGS